MAKWAEPLRTMVISYNLNNLGYIPGTIATNPRRLIGTTPHTGSLGCQPLADLLGRLRTDLWITGSL